MLNAYILQSSFSVIKLKLYSFSFIIKVATTCGTEKISDKRFLATIWVSKLLKCLLVHQAFVESQVYRYEILSEVKNREE